MAQMLSGIEKEFEVPGKTDCHDMPHYESFSEVLSKSLDEKIKQI